MQKNWLPSLRLVGISEGGFQASRSDSGNFCNGVLVGTNWGIAAPTLRQWIGRCPTMQEMKALPRATANLIYKARYWDTIRGDDLPLGLDYAVFDYAVNSGPGRGVRDLQAVVGTTRDGIIGTITLKAVARHDPKALINALCDRRLGFLKHVSSWPIWGRGWTNRVREVRANALAMAKDSAI